MKKKVADILGSAQLPVMICVASDNAGGEETDLTVSLFSDATTDTKFSVMSNVENPHSPASGEYIAAGDQKPVETASMNRIETLAGLVCVANCVGCKHDTYVTEETAEAIDGQAFYCTSCGEQVEAFYDGDFKAETAGEDDELTEDDAEDVVDVVEEEDEDTSDEEEETTDEEPTEDDVDATDESVEEEETEDDSENLDEEEEVATASAEEIKTEDAPADAEVSEARTVKVETASVANYEDQLQFAMLSDTSRVELFLGNTHIGSLLKDEASESVQKTFTNSQVLRTVFGSEFWKNATEIASGNTESLNDFGFQPATIEVTVDKVVANEIEKATEELKATQEEVNQQTTDAVVSTIQTAMAGLDKGLLKGPSLVRELAQELARFNVQQPVEVAKRFAQKFSGSFFKAVVEQASALRTHSPDYIRGFTATVENASYNVEDTVQESAALLTSAASSYKASPKPEVRDAIVEKASAPAPASDGNKFKGLFDKMARR